MKKNQYAALRAFYAARPARRRLLCSLCRGLPLLVAAVYCMMVAVLFWTRRAVPWDLIGYPALTLGAVEVLRHLFPRERPYTRYGFEPLIGHGRSSSFPSRHCASAALIALAAGSLAPSLGFALGGAALLIGATRVLAGVHFPRDIAAGFLLALAIGLPGFHFFL